MYKLSIVLSFLLLGNQAAYGQTKTATGPPPADKTVDKPGIKNSKGPGDWSHLFQLIKFKNLRESKFQFETGLSFYSVSYDTWNFRRFEPFVKLRWAIGKYVNLYTLFSTDFSSVDYELSHFKMKDTDVSFTTGIKTSLKHTFGGGAQILLFGWKKFNMYGYAQTQSASASSASLESAVLTLDGMRFDIFDRVKNYIDITYTFERYDCGGILSYQFLSWFTMSATAGYVWLDVQIKLALKPELGDVLRTALGTYDERVVPSRLSISQSSAFGMLGLKFKLYKWLHLNLEGTILPSDNPIYYGQISFSAE